MCVIADFRLEVHRLNDQSVRHFVVPDSDDGIGESDSEHHSDFAPQCDDASHSTATISDSSSGKRTAGKRCPTNGDSGGDSGGGDDMEKVFACETLWMCIVTTLNWGLRNGGGIGDVLRSVDPMVRMLSGPRGTTIALF